MSYPQVPAFFRDSDIVYHYTTTEVAIQYILKDMKLKLSPRLNSADPIENNAFVHWITTTNLDEDNEDAYQIAKETKKIFSNVKHVCFCKNLNVKNASLKGFPEFEKFGFAKPRMWDQYGDKYKGVCLVLSREQLNNEAKVNGYISGNVKYKTYQNFENERGEINADTLDQIGIDNYKRAYINYTKKRLFRKHSDYINENEFRICSFDDKSNEYLDISKALKGVIVTNLGLNQHLYDTLAKQIGALSNTNLYILSFKDERLRFREYSVYLRKVNEDRKRKLKKQV